MKEIVNKKRSVGRPKKFDKSMFMTVIYLTEELKTKAYKIGDGNISDGIRIALQAFNKNREA